MKKIKIIALMLLVSFFMIKPTSNAMGNNEVGKSLVLFVGDKDVNLEYSNYRLISSNLNMDKVGEYVNLYKNKETGELINKTIYVINKNELTDQTKAFFKEEEIASSNRNITYVTRGMVKNSYLYISTVKNENSIHDWDDTYLTYVVDGEIIWDSLLVDDLQIVIKDIQIENDRIVICGEAYFSPSLLDIYIDTFDFNGKRINVKFCGGTLNDQISNLFVTKDAYYVVGTTESVKGDIGGTRDGKDMFMMIFDHETLKIKNVQYYNLSGDDECVGGVILDDYIYLFQKYKSSRLQEVRVVKTNLEGEIVDTKEVASGLYVTTVNCLVGEGNIYYIFREQTTVETKKIKVINENLESYLLYTDNDENFYLQKAYLNDDELVLFYNVINKNKGFIKKINIRYDDEIINSYVDYDLSTLRNINYNLFKIENNIINKVSISFLQVDKFNNLTIEDENSKITDGLVLIDGYQVDVNKNKSSLDFDSSYFGYYPVLFYYSGGSLDFCYTANVQVLSNPSIVMNKVHDSNLVLTFNGEGYLNNHLIKSGEVITEDGNYTLKLIGKGGATAEYKFTVKKQSFELPTLTKVENDESNEILNNINKDYVPYSEIMSVSYDTDSSTPKAETIWWPLFIPVSITSIAIVLFMKGALV